MTLITAHSGSDGLPENSMEFVRFFADKKDVATIEVDVMKDAEGNLVLNHDPIVDGQDYVKLEEVLAYLSEVKSHLFLNLDLKQEGIEGDVMTLAAQYGLADAIYLSGGVTFDYLKNHGDRVLMNVESGMDIDWQDLRVLDAKKYVKAALYKIKNAGAKFVNMDHRFYDRSIHELCDYLDLKISLWTIQDLNLLEEYVEAGVYTLTTTKAWAYAENLEARVSQSQVIQGK